MNDNKKKYFVIQSFMKPFWIVFDNLKTFLLQGLLFSGVVVLLSYLMGQKYLCFFNQQMAENMYCPEMNTWYFPYLLLKLLIIAVFINVWYDTVFKNVQINKEYFKSGLKKIWKTFVLLLVFIAINFLPVISSLLLLFRVPNPIWQIEQLYFTVVSTGFLAPFLLIRFYGLFAEFLAGHNWKQFKIMWHKTSGSAMKIVLSCALLFLVGILMLIVFIGFFKSEVNLPPEIYNIWAEFVFAFVNCFIIVLLINFFEVQREEFLK